MRSFRLDPYLWVHLAGLAAVPLWLDVCLLGLATGEPALPTWVELGVIGVTGILPVAWMQWQKPFSIFSLVLLALRPDRMGEDRRRILRLFKDPLVKFLAALAPIPLIWALGKLYTLAPLASDLTPFTAGGRSLGLLVAAIAFLLANLFVQVPVSVLRVLATPQRVFDKLPPYPAEQVKQDFTILGFRVNRILPDWQALPKSVAATQADSAVTVRPSQPAATTLEEDLEAWETAVEVSSGLSLDSHPSAVEPAATEVVAVEPAVESLDMAAGIVPEVELEPSASSEPASLEEALEAAEPVSEETAVVGGEVEAHGAVETPAPLPIATSQASSPDEPWAHPEPDGSTAESAELGGSETGTEINSSPSSAAASDSSEPSWHA